MIRPFHLLLLLSVLFVWGINFVAIKAGLQYLPPIFLCFTRFLLCSIPLFFYLKKPIPPLKTVCLYSFIMFVFQFTLLFFSIHVGLSAALASLLLQTQSFFALFIAVFFLGESYHPTQALGSFAAFLGISLVASHIGSDAPPLGLFLILISAFTWAMGSVIARQIKNCSGVSLVLWGSLFAWPPLLLLSLWVEGPSLIWSCLQHCHWTGAASVLYIAYGATIFGFGIWNQLLQTYSLSKISPFTLLVPIVGMLSASFLLGESLPWWKIGAAFLILGGLCIHQFGAKKRPSQQSSGKVGA